ncbi:MAG: RNA pyrophosphohydrolase, partial [Burkholderiales bacterium]|nr:RNA pyrophosphohydrolase [Burkholderiales bacterium]
YRLNVGVVLLGKDNQVFWGRRKGESSWQFPQGGLYEDEEVEVAMFRELNEELGLNSEHVQILGCTNDWLYYDVPSIYNRSYNKTYRGQKQIWYLLKLIGKDHDINVKFHKEQEFDAWRWIDYWEPIDLVIDFKQEVYRKALNELTQFLP